MCTENSETREKTKKRAIENEKGTEKAERKGGKNTKKRKKVSIVFKSFDCGLEKLQSCIKKLHPLRKKASTRPATREKVAKH